MIEFEIYETYTGCLSLSVSITDIDSFYRAQFFCPYRVTKAIFPLEIKDADTLVGK